MPARRTSIIAAALWIAMMLVVALTVALVARSPSTAVPGQWAFRGANAALAVSFGSIGALVAWQRPRNPLGWLFSVNGLLAGVSAFTLEYATEALVVSPGTLPLAEFSAWLGSWTWMPAIGGVVWALVIFPDGAVPSPRWRRIRWVVPLVTALGTIGLAFGAGPLDSFRVLDNPYALLSEGVASALLAIAFVSGAIALSWLALEFALRFRRSTGDERQQLKWLFASVGILAVAISIGAVTTVTRTSAPVIDVLTVLAFAAVPAACGVAILRYRLYDIDEIVRHTLVYTTLTAVLAGVYTAAVALFQRVFLAFTGERSDAAIVLATLVLATAFTPAKNALQSAVDRRFRAPVGAAGDALASGSTIAALDERIRAVVREELARSR